MAHQVEVMRLATPVRAVLAATALVLAASCSDPAAGTLSYVSLDIAVAPLRSHYPVGDSAWAVAIGDAGAGAGPVPAGWRSANTAVATVDTAGLIRFVGRGTAIIEAWAGDTMVQISLVVRGRLHYGRISSSELWAVADTPHVVSRLEVRGPGAPILSIEPGVVVRARPGTQIAFGSLDESGSLVVLPGADGVVMEGDSAGTATWVGLSFQGSTSSELRNVTLRHCGATAPYGAAGPGCIRSAAFGTTLLMDSVTVIGPPLAGLTLWPGVRFAPGSRALTITDVAGHVATIDADAVAGFPAGGRFERNSDNTIYIRGGLVSQSGVWRNVAAPYRLQGEVRVIGAASPVLTLPAGFTIQLDPPAAFIVGSQAHEAPIPGSLVIGEAGASPVVLDAAGPGWAGILVDRGAAAVTLSNTVLRNCGYERWSACIGSVEGAPARLRVEDVTVENSRGVGVYLAAGVAFDTGSVGLTIVGSQGSAGLAVPANEVPTVPAGTYSGNAGPGILVTDGSVTRSGVWRNRGLPYRVSGIVIDDPVTNPAVTLEPGVELQFAAGARIVVAGYAGALVAIGTAAQPIVFSSATPGVAGSWEGVVLGPRVDTRTRLEFVEIRDAGAGQANWAGALILWNDPGGLLRNSLVLRSPSCGMVLYGAAPAWTDDYTAPAFNNTFTSVAGPMRCLFATP